MKNPPIKAKHFRLQMKINYAIRPLQAGEYAALDAFLYHAIFVEPGQSPPPRNITKEPALARYISGFGRHGDLCLVAEASGVLIGAAWVRQFKRSAPGYGFIDAATPELSISLLPGYRGKGIGTALLAQLFVQLTAQGHKAVCLSVQPQNQAMALYEKLGFCVYRHKQDGSVIMRKAL